MRVNPVCSSDALHSGLEWTTWAAKPVCMECGAHFTWPPPAPGTHESDCMERGKIGKWHRAQRDWGDDEIVDWHAARAWSRAHATKEGQ